MNKLRKEVYKWSIDLVKEGKILQGIFLLLSTWNFAYFRYHMTNFNLKKFEKIINNADFDYFKKMKFEKVDFNNTVIEDKIKKIYESFSDIVGIKYVGASKVLHLMCPDFFMMWDNSIKNEYRKQSPRGYINEKSHGYLNFMRKMQAEYKRGKFDAYINKHKDVTIPRAIDIWNIENITKKTIHPDK
ncbi:MAG: hypothetical protein FVQ77_11610 [Cytophagales bacterium]|nr:hypothetical protein [Cytophagales bacterium]